MGLRCVGEAQPGGGRCSPCPPRPCGEDGAKLRELPLGWGHQLHVQEQRVCRRGAAPLAPGLLPLLGSRSGAHLWQPETSSGVGPAHVGAAEPRGLTPGPSRGRQQRGMSQLGRAGPRAGSGFTKSSRPQRRSLSVERTRLRAPLRGRALIAAGLPQRHPALRPRGNPPSTFQSVLGTKEPFPERERCCQLYGLGVFQPFNLVSRICIKC